MKHLKILSMLLAILMLLPMVLAGCAKDDGGKNSPGQDVNVVKETEDKSSVYDSEIHDMHGHEFWFLVRETTHQHLATNEVYAEELNGDKVNDAVFRRNALLEEKYNCKIYEERNANPSTAIREQLIAGEYQYDFIYHGVSSLRPLSASNLLVDFYEIESIDLSKTWWDMNAVLGFSIAGKAYYVTGAGGTLDERASWVIYFNKDFIEKADLESPYDLVRKGQWTIDKMYDYMMECKEDLNGDGVYEIGTDRFGYVGEQLNNWMHVAACNVHLSRMSADGDIEIPATVNKDVLNAWNALRPLLTSEYRNVTDNGGFGAGLAVFYGCNAGVLLNLAKKSINWGVVPMPKLNEEQEEYWTSVNSGWCYGYAIPVTTDSTPDYEQNGFTSGREQAAYFLEAFFYQSLGTLQTAFYDQVLKYQVVKDSQSSEMLDIAFKNKLYDPVVIFNFGSIGTTLFSQTGSNGSGGAGYGSFKGTDVNYDTLVSTYESRVEAARKALSNYINYITQED